MVERRFLSSARVQWIPQFCSQAWSRLPSLPSALRADLLSSPRVLPQAALNPRPLAKQPRRLPLSPFSVPSPGQSRSSELEFQVEAACVGVLISYLQSENTEGRPFLLT